MGLLARRDSNELFNCRFERQLSIYLKMVEQRTFCGSIPEAFGIFSASVFLPFFRGDAMLTTDARKQIEEEATRYTTPESMAE